MFRPKRRQGSNPNWRDVAKQKKDDQADLLKPYMIPENELPSEDGVLEFLETTDVFPELDREIVNEANAFELLKKMKEGTWTCKQVIMAYIKRATVAHQLTNCLTEIDFDAAIDRAKNLDKMRDQGIVLPLHGLPISLKDQFNIKVLDTTLGYIGRANDPKETEAALVTMLKKLGANVFVKTNLPQSIMVAETENFLWGLTTNPLNRKFTPGGSSGGESALLLSKGSIIGWGTDLGGSVRIPQAMTGGYGYRPTHHRFPYRNVPVTCDGESHVPSVIGPMTRDFPSLVMISKAILQEEPWNYDPICVPMPWNQTEFDNARSRKLRIGVLWDNNIVRPLPPVKRALEVAVEKLKAAGHDLIPFNAEEVEKAAFELSDTFFSVDGGEDVRRDLSKLNEPEHPAVTKLFQGKDSRSIYDYWNLQVQKRKIQECYFERWKATAKKTKSGEPIDFILGPALASSAVPLNKARGINYTKVYNLLNYPAVVFPAGAIDKNVDLPASFEPRSDMEKNVMDLYDPEAMHGFPVNLQLAARSFQDEKLLGGLTNILSDLDISSYNLDESGLHI
ncbi:hypothetical protein TRICI_006153 [Trichomonascus ciferrii]|uniref:Amidase domain-containing protein n=1 Tax=Trichomonascus ciferrii TaxID=44093 RepID=A0A642UKK6_9ASCO|nr:hypothetical protein TRICI_006153 [Trichomonascus ciferrii]